MKLVEPMLATLAHQPFDRPGWVYEEKYDGIRAMAYRDGERVRLVSRNLKDITVEFAEVARAIEPLQGGDLVLDGEIVAFDAHDVSRFQLLQRRALGEPIRPAFAVFDCLERDGASLLRRPLRERRVALEEIVPARGPSLMRARRLPVDGFAAFRTAQRTGWEGILAKDEASPYEAGRRSRSWLKVKCRKQSEFVIGGFTAPRGLRRCLGALLLGLYEGKRLRYVGKVGTGFSASMLASLSTTLRRLRADSSPFQPAPREDATWVRPRLVGEIAYAEWTADGKLRQPAFMGLRHDKKPTECTWVERET
ncbi:MAG: non-homologous end-joining DNA ligase [Labilithrix sp.]|nr:non-homologous end-joining DNA ligase [Labilithrix sp.]